MLSVVVVDVSVWAGPDESSHSGLDNRRETNDDVDGLIMKMDSERTMVFDDTFEVIDKRGVPLCTLFSALSSAK